MLWADDLEREIEVGICKKDKYGVDDERVGIIGGDLKTVRTK